MINTNNLKRFVAIILISILAIFALLPLTVYSDSKFNMSYIYFGDSSLYKYYVDRSNGSLDVLSPSYFDLNEDGSLKITNALNINLINDMHNKGLRVVPFLSNHWDRQKGKLALANRENLAQQIADAIETYNLDGVNVDIENVTETERDMYTDFVRILRIILPPNKEVSVAVAPNPYNFTRGWQGSYDYEALSKYSDYLMIMAYDEHYQGSEPGPVASSDFVERSIKYALARVPKEKIVIGIPFFGRFWKVGENYGGYGIGAEQVDILVEKYSGKVIYDKATNSAKAIITIKPGDEESNVLGKKLGAGTYIIWYENEKSIKYKLRLAQKYDIKGTGSWSLGQENGATWSYYSLWLNGHYFSDAEGHWAQKDIMLAEEKGWMVGISSNMFAPGNSLTRAEAAAVLVRAFGLELKEKEKYFSDTLKHWAKDEIEIARQNNIVSGVGDGNFMPNKPVTRQEMAVMLDNILMLPQNGEEIKNPFYDVSRKNNGWSYDSIIKTASYGIFYGGDDGGFHPTDNTTRAEMAALMNRISGYIN